MKIMMLAVFGAKSTNNSQANCFEKNGHTVIRYNYRVRAKHIGINGRDDEIINICKNEKPDLVIFSKCNAMNLRVVEACNKISKTCIWYMDPLGNFNSGLIKKIELANFTCCALTAPFEEAKKYSNNVFFLQEGFDPNCNFYIPDLEYRYDVSFIGGLRKKRGVYHNQIMFKVINDAYGKQHSKAVCSTKINLNFTEGGTSDRTYKILASKGFLLTEPWPMMGEDFEVGRDFDTFCGVIELKNKISYYLTHFDEAQEIAEHGFRTVQKFSRINWAKKIIEFYNLL